MSRFHSNVWSPERTHEPPLAFIYENDGLFEVKRYQALTLVARCTTATAAEAAARLLVL